MNNGLIGPSPDDEDIAPVPPIPAGTPQADRATFHAGKLPSYA